MSSSTIMLKPVKELLGMNFFIPDYQRGYRWKEQQAEDLLNDIWAFREKNTVYCIQPLVVQKDQSKDIMDEIKKCQDVKAVEEVLQSARWNVVDGQQRLTTIFLILSALDIKNPYILDYQTRTNSKKLLENVENLNVKATDNIDYYHITNVYQTVKAWFATKNAEEKLQFKETLLEKVHFIWYQIPEGKEEAIAAFTRLNIGKIPLTDSELIKALFLNRANFDASVSDLEKQQREIALEWDQIEYSLQNDEFWLFLHDTGYTKPTRIDFILDMVYEKDMFEIKPNPNNKRGENKKRHLAKLAEFNKIIGTDEHATFRYFHYYFTTEKKDLKKAWKIISDYYRIFNEWYHDYKMYHYVGYLSCFDNASKLISDLVDKWNEKTKDDFTVALKNLILKTLQANEGFPDLKNFKYDEEYKAGRTISKTKCCSILLLHNVETVIQQNDKLSLNQKYCLPNFSKFPFHLYKRESWNVEHIRPNAGDDLEDDKIRKVYLLLAQQYVGHIADLNEKIEKYFEEKDDGKPSFEEIQTQIAEHDGSLNDSDKNKIWNYALLDESTNKEYGNMIFPVKRAFIANKENGKKIKYTAKNGKLEASDTVPEIAFVPPCTRNVFAKFYTAIPQTMLAWTEQDAQAYLDDMTEKLKYYIDLAKEEAK